MKPWRTEATPKAGTHHRQHGDGKSLQATRRSSASGSGGARSYVINLQTVEADHQRLPRLLCF